MYIHTKLKVKITGKIEKPLQELFDEYIENEDFEGIKSLKGFFSDLTKRGLIM